MFVARPRVLSVRLIRVSTGLMWSLRVLLFWIALATTAGAQTTALPELTCGPLGPSTEKGSVARVSALFERPQSVSQLLQNLKLAYEKDLFIQPAFYDDSNLEKFFAGNAVAWGKPRQLSSPATSARDIEITADTRVFPELTIRILRSCIPQYKHVSPNRNVVYSIAENAHLELQVEALPEFNVAAVREVLGAETVVQIDDGGVNDEFGGPASAGRTTKGRLVYEDKTPATHVETPVKVNKLSFVVKLDRRPAPPALEHLRDTDSIESIIASQFGR